MWDMIWHQSNILNYQFETYLQFDLSTIILMNKFFQH